MPKTRREIAREVDEILRTPGSVLSDVASGVALHRESAARDLGPSIGSTGSGKLVYEHAVSSDYNGFTKQDHLDAADLHRDFASENRMNYKFRAHQGIADEHERRAVLLSEKPGTPERRGTLSHAATKPSRGAKSRALAMSPTLIAEKYRPFARSPSWKWWIHLPGSVSTIGEGSTEAKAWQAAVDFLSARAPKTL